MPASSIIGHNFYAYDLNVLARYGLVPKVLVEDSLYMHHVKAPEEPHRLEYVASLFSNQSYWKDEGKSGEEGEGVDDEVLWTYCGLDCTGTGSTASNLHVSQAQLEIKYKLAALAHRMTQRGLLVDQDERDRQRKLYREKLTLAAANLPDINPGSNAQVARVLFEKLQFPVLRRTETGAPSVDINTLRDLEKYVATEEQSNFLINLRAWRRAAKVLGTYIDGLPILADGCIHPIWKAGLAETGRWRSSDPNGQNFPPLLRPIIRARDGYCFISFDAKQLELRILAYLSECSYLLEAFKATDPHEMLVYALFYGGKPIEQARAEYNALPADQRKRLRTLEKNFVYSQAYGGDWYTAFLAIRKHFPAIKEKDVRDLTVKWKALTPEIAYWGQGVVAKFQNEGKLDSLLGHQTWYFPGGAEMTDFANRPIQGAASDIMNQKILELDAWFLARGFAGGIVTQEHDGIMLEVEEEQVDEVSKGALELLETPIQGYTFPFDMKVSGHWQ